MSDETDMIILHNLSIEKVRRVTMRNFLKSILRILSRPKVNTCSGDCAGDFKI